MNKLDDFPTLINVLIIIHTPRFVAVCLLSLLINRRRAGNNFNRTRIEEVSLEDSVVEVLMDSLGIE